VGVVPHTEAVDSNSTVALQMITLTLRTTSVNGTAVVSFVESEAVLAAMKVPVSASPARDCTHLS
jgi:hypothetical protein